MKIPKSLILAASLLFVSISAWSAPEDTDAFLNIQSQIAEMNEFNCQEVLNGITKYALEASSEKQIELSTRLTARYLAEAGKLRGLCAEQESLARTILISLAVGP